jgi:uncharacterized membrane protein
MSRLINNNIQLLKTIAVGVASLISITGIILVCRGSEPRGTVVDFKSVFIEGKIETGSVGVALIFLGVVIIVAVLFFRYPATAETTEIRVGDVEVKVPGSPDEQRLKTIATSIGLFVEKAGKSKPHQP